MIVTNKEKAIKGCSLAFYEIVKEHGIKHLEKIYTFFNNYKNQFTIEYFNFFRDARCTMEDKQKYLKIFLSFIPKIDYLHNFFLVLYKDNLLYLAADIINAFLQYAKNAIKYEEGIITVPKSISKSQINKISKFFAKKFNYKNIYFLINIDPSIKHGLIVAINNKIFDYSLKTRILNLKNEILK